MTTPVTWTAAARDDVLEIVDYIATHSPINAGKILDRLEARAASLDQFPGRGRISPEVRHLGITSIRELIENPWRIVYEYSGQEREVLIVGVFDGRRDLQSVLLERLLRLSQEDEHGGREWTIDEINAEIAAARKERKQGIRKPKKS